jgi:hypothetical protein
MIFCLTAGILAGFVLPYNERKGKHILPPPDRWQRRRKRQQRR